MKKKINLNQTNHVNVHILLHIAFNKATNIKEVHCKRWQLRTYLNYLMQVNRISLAEMEFGNSVCKTIWPGMDEDDVKILYEHVISKHNLCEGGSIQSYSRLVYFGQKVHKPK